MLSFLFIALVNLETFWEEPLYNMQRYLDIDRNFYFSYDIVLLLDL